MSWQDLTENSWTNHGSNLSITGGLALKLALPLLDGKSSEEEWCQFLSILHTIKLVVLPCWPLKRFQDYGLLNWHPLRQCVRLCVASFKTMKGFIQLVHVKCSSKKSWKQILMYVLTSWNWYLLQIWMISVKSSVKNTIGYNKILVLLLLTHSILFILVILTMPYKDDWLVCNLYVMICSRCDDTSNSCTSSKRHHVQRLTMHQLNITSILIVAWNQMQ